MYSVTLSLNQIRTVDLNTESIIREITNEIARLQQAKQLLSDTFTPSGPGRPPKVVSAKPKKARRQLSAEARARIAAAQRARWAKARKSSDKKAKA